MFRRTYESYVLKGGDYGVFSPEAAPFSLPRYLKLSVQEQGKARHLKKQQLSCQRGIT